MNNLNMAVISLGGSIIAPDKVDVTFLKELNKNLREYLKKDKSRKLILVCGGGAPARIYQQALREIIADAPSEEQDWLEIGRAHV